MQKMWLPNKQVKRGHSKRCLEHTHAKRKRWGEVKQIGDFVETIHGVKGILTEIRKGGY